MPYTSARIGEKANKHTIKQVQTLNLLPKVNVKLQTFLFLSLCTVRFIYLF